MCVILSSLLSFGFQIQEGIVKVAGRGSRNEKIEGNVVHKKVILLRKILLIASKHEILMSWKT